MRLAEKDIQVIRATVRRRFGSEARVYLFGSRLDDSARGGDIDLYVELDTVQRNRASAASRLAAELQQALGDQHIDVVIADPSTPRQRIHDLARSQGSRL